MITVAYHLIRPARRTWLSGIPAMTPEEFETQLVYLKSRYRILEPQELLEAVRRGALPDDGCVLTFDDGYIGQYEDALPVLQAHRLKALFFMPTSVLEDAKCPTVEKQRVLQYGLWTYDEFYRRFGESLRVSCPEVDPGAYAATDENLASARSYYAEYAFYSPLERLFRKVRECVLTGPQFDTAIDAMFAAEFDEGDFVGRYFMRWHHLEELRDRGMEIGGHGHSHLIETAVGADVAVADALHSLAVLHARLGKRVWSYCYPYGIFRPETVSAIAGGGVEAAFTCRPGHGDAGSSLLLDRVDCRSLS